MQNRCSRLAVLVIFFGCRFYFYTLLGRPRVHGRGDGHSSRQSRSVCRTLIDENPQLVQMKNQYGWTLLHIAARHGTVTIIQLLVEKGADMNARDRLGWTPLHTAASAGRLDNFDYLVAHGADVNAKSNSGATPRDYAQRAGHREAATHTGEHSRGAAPLKSDSPSIATGAVASASPGAPIQQQTSGPETAAADQMPDLAQLGSFTVLPADVVCSIQDMQANEATKGWIAKSAAGISCSMRGRGLAGQKKIEFLFQGSGRWPGVNQGFRRNPADHPRHTAGRWSAASRWRQGDGS